MLRFELDGAQEAEFPTENLQAFALAYLKFKYSSPCTARRRTYGYFAPLKDAEMPEENILYGPDREEAYRSLNWIFRHCQRLREFDRFFDAAHNQYWESKSIPGLVLLKQWADESTIKPGLYTGRIGHFQPADYDEIWLTVRSLKSMPRDPFGNIRHVPLLSPSTQLWHHALDLQKSGNWDQDSFMSDFAPKFLNEMLQPEPYQKLQELRERIKSEAILCVCYCKNEALCHRSLLKLIMETMAASEK